MAPSKQLPKLAYLDISNNLFSAKLPALNFKQLSAGCSLNGNDFTCPLVGLIYCEAGLLDFFFFNYNSSGRLRGWRV